MVLRIITATLLGPLAASLSVGLIVGLYWAAVAGFSEGFVRSSYEGLGLFVATLFFGTVFTGLFAIGFSLISQLPLILVFRTWSRWPLWVHLIWSGAIGALAFLAFLNADGRMLGRSFSQEGLVNMLVLSGMGVLGGIGVGLLWYWLVFRAPGEASA